MKNSRNVSYYGRKIITKKEAFEVLESLTEKLNKFFDLEESEKLTTKQYLKTIVWASITVTTIFTLGFIFNKMILNGWFS